MYAKWFSKLILQPYQALPHPPKYKATSSGNKADLYREGAEHHNGQFYPRVFTKKYSPFGHFNINI